MRAIKVIATLIILTSVFLAGCQAAEPTAETGLEESAYPLEGYPIYDYGDTGDTAYPIFALDGTLLTSTQNWVLAESKINNQGQTPAKKSISFTMDGRYSQTTDGVSIAGAWSLVTPSGVATLYLIPDGGEGQSIEIVNLDATSLTLKFEQDGSLIEELYHPAN